MKKLTFIALAAIVAVGASAQDTFKKVSKLKTYEEASKEVKAATDALMQADEAAKCYNYLVDLSVKKIANEVGTMTENQLAEQMGTKKKDVDTKGLYEATFNAITDAKTCDEFDNQPNAKGKVAPKFHKKNAERLYGYRIHLINGGIACQEAGDMEGFYRYLSLYVDSDQFPLFAEMDRSKDAYLSQMAYFSAVSAYQAKDYKNAEKYASIGQKDEKYGPDCTNIIAQSMSQGLKTREDSLNYVNKLKAMYEKDPSNEGVYSTIITTCMKMGDLDAANKFIDEGLAKNPKNYSAIVLRGQMCADSQKWADAIQWFEKGLEVQPENIPLLGILGGCHLKRAAEAEEKAAGKSGIVPAAAKKVINEERHKAEELLEKAKELDIVMEHKGNWAYNLYNCYYTLYGEKDPRTQKAKTIAGVE